MANLTKRGLAERVAEETGLSLNKASQVVTSVFSTITDVIKDGGSVDVTGFGKFGTRHVETRMAMNLHTKEKVEVPAHNAVTFKVSKTLKDAVK